eukprot:3580628-Rhodomonas_salina.1
MGYGSSNRNQFKAGKWALEIGHWKRGIGNGALDAESGNRRCVVVLLQLLALLGATLRLLDGCGDRTSGLGPGPILEHKVVGGNLQSHSVSTHRYLESLEVM